MRSKAALAYSLLFLAAVAIATTFSAAHVAMALAISTACFAPIRLFFSLRSAPVTPASMMRAIRYPLIATCVMGATLIPLEGTVYPARAGAGLAIGIVAGLITYVVTWTATASGRAELMQFVTAIRSVQRRRA